ncbi:aminoacyl-tRNA hydrolase [Gleimia europaea]|uniref:Peptidyl-tRNA hydrolase n=1 Tax=Gleimia europaea ACS-120-V-Col10b TaxID=883069 RepID=A0A9W5RD00_9ACTO|nr:aminoacyl-tRNA hydrolase [Gleimia europaea]EPD29516.1 peptidyl-tRNA hydrolase [Gleimia europaea ACS-120-V-Col10b]
MQETANQWLIVGLGNPGSKYENNLHNAGRIVLHAVADYAGASFSKHRAGAYVANARIGMLPGGRPGPAAILAYPDSYMNLSGHAVSKLMQFYGVKPDHLLVVHDELDIEPHTLRLKRGGGEGGHNGLRSISQSIGTKDYNRLRFGVGRPPGRMDAAAFVLSDFPKKDLDEWAVTVRLAADAIEDVVTLGFEQAQQKLHTA